MKYQDVHLEDKTLLENFRALWESKNYADAINLLSRASLTDKQIVADTLNYILRQTEALENQSDPTFKTDKIKVSRTAPSGLKKGEIWFKEED